MENSANFVPPWPPNFLSLPPKTQNWISWLFSVINDLLATNGRLNARVAELESEKAADKELLKQKDDQIKQKDDQNAQLMSRIVELENRLNTNSTNSNRPPSTDPPHVQRSKTSSQETSDSADGAASDSSENSEKQEKPKKKRPYHPGASQKPLTPTEEKDCIPQVCPHCGGTHFDGLTECSSFQHVELPALVLTVILFHIFRGRCSNCHREVKGTIPQEFQASYGTRFTAFIAYLLSEGGVPRRQVQKLMKDIFGLPISQGAIQNIVDRTSEAIEPLYEAIGESVRRSPACHIDETSWPTHGQMGRHLHWLWVMCCSLLAFFMIDPHRSKESFKRLIGDWRGILISDDYGIYQGWVGDRQSCLAHIKREIRKFLESSCPEERKFGKLADAIITTLCKMGPDSTTVREIWTLKSRIVKLARRFGKQKGKVGAFARRLERNFESLWLFVVEPRVDKTNNFAERQIRTAVCHRKISLGSSAKKGECWMERSLSLRKTCALQGKSYFDVLVESINRSMRNLRQRTYWIRKAIWRQFHAWIYDID